MTSGSRPPPTPDRFHLDRFLEAQQHAYATALEELHAGRKQSHWIWYVFPQLRGLGVSAMADTYGLSGLSEARAYLAHPILGHRLRESIEAMLRHRAASAESILGALDALKFRSCLTLFAQVDPSHPAVAAALDWFFAGQLDARTLQLLAALEGPGDPPPAAPHRGQH